ncbi:MAG: hypothetical protein AAF471_08805, partial [Myxococcota bacterium]
MSSAQAATLLYACGLTRDPIFVPWLASAVLTGKWNERKLSDVARGRAALALAMTSDPVAIATLEKVIR